MACCQKTQSHYLKQYQLLISEVLWHLPETKFMASAQAPSVHNEFEKYTFIITLTSPRSQWVNFQGPCTNPECFYWFELRDNELPWHSIKLLRAEVINNKGVYRQLLTQPVQLGLIHNTLERINLVKKKSKSLNNQKSSSQLTHQGLQKMSDIL